MRKDIKCNDPDRRLIDFADGYATTGTGLFKDLKVRTTIYEDGSVGESYEIRKETKPEA